VFIVFASFGEAPFNPLVHHLMQIFAIQQVQVQLSREPA
jgi:hypothetical protein